MLTNGLETMSQAGMVGENTGDPFIFSFFFVSQQTASWDSLRFLKACFDVFIFVSSSS